MTVLFVQSAQLLPPAKRQQTHQQGWKMMTVMMMMIMMTMWESGLSYNQAAHECSRWESLTRLAKTDQSLSRRPLAPGMVQNRKSSLICTRKFKQKGVYEIIVFFLQYFKGFFGGGVDNHSAGLRLICLTLDVLCISLCM